VERMSANVGEACSAAVLNGHDVITIAHASPNRAINLGAQIGFRLPAISSSLGRVLLATLDDRQLDQLLAQARPEKLTAVTIVDRAELKRAIRKARDENYSLVDQEAEVGFRSISVPLRRYDGTVVASLNIGTPSNRCTLETMRNVLLPKLTALAAELQGQLI
jgi:IclR family pca regulon transcriptional regulator